ncbi:MAG TPA: carbon-nitrogen hydrolase family protein [Solirubrobacteraceae bacterium]|nr:carbon-nitrogen hydrolase family protein [Solirubrobacteraceae bacterium]
MPDGSPGPLRIGLAQWCAIPGDGARNLADACELIARAGAAGCRLVVLPELWASGYDARTLAADLRACAEPLDGPRGARLAALAREHSLWLAAGSVPELDADGRIYNTLALYDPDGRLVASHRKFHRYLPGGEDRAFSAGEGPTVCDCGPELGVVGLSICYDGDFPETGRALREAGARLVLQPAAYEHGAESWWDRLYPAAALANGQWWILVNQSGAAGFGASRVISPLGEILAEAAGRGPAVGETPAPELLVADIDLAGEIARADAEAGSLFGERLPGAPVRRLIAPGRRLSATAAVP